MVFSSPPTDIQIRLLPFSSSPRQGTEVGRSNKIFPLSLCYLGLDLVLFSQSNSHLRNKSPSCLSGKELGDSLALLQAQWLILHPIESSVLTTQGRDSSEGEGK